MINVEFSNISGIEVAFSGESGITAVLSNINYREEMKYLQTFSIEAEEEKVLTTPITVEPYNIEFILPDGSISKVLTSGMGTPQYDYDDDGYLRVTVYSAVAMTDVKLKLLY